MVAHCQGSTLEVEMGVVWGQCSVPMGKPSRQPSSYQWAWQWKWNATAGLFSRGAEHPLLPMTGEAHSASGSSLSPAAAAILLSPQLLGTPWSKVSGKALLCLLSGGSRSLGNMTLTSPGKGGLILSQLMSGICFSCKMSLDTVLAAGTGADPQYWQNPWGRGTMLCLHRCCSCSGQLGTMKQGTG